MTHRASFPNPARPTCWPGEEHHFRSDFEIGDVVRFGDTGGGLGRIVAYNNTHSHLRAGRIVHLEPVGPNYGTDLAGSWERDLAASEPGDVGSHRNERGEHVRASWAPIVTARAERDANPDAPAWVVTPRTKEHA